MSGKISDVVGRKPVLIGALVALLVGLGVFLIADSMAMLLLARTIHGAAVGSIVVAGAAALLDLRPNHGVRTGQLSGVSFNIGDDGRHHRFGTAGPVRTTSVAHPVCRGRGDLPGDRCRPAGAERAAHRPHPWSHPAGQTGCARGDPRRLLVLRAGRHGLLVGCSACCCRSIRHSAAQQTHIDNLVFGGAVVATTAFAAAMAQLAATRLPARYSAIIGDIGMAVSCC